MLMFILHNNLGFDFIVRVHDVYVYHVFYHEFYFLCATLYNKDMILNCVLISLH